MRDEYSKIQEYIKSYTMEKHYAPTVREVAKYIGRSVSYTHHFICEMKEQGQLLGDPCIPRTLRIPEE